MENNRTILIELTEFIRMEANKNFKDMLVRLGKNIANARRGAHRTQAEIAEIIGIDALSISRIEWGAVAPSLYTLSRIALALGVSIPALFTGVSTSTYSLAEGIADSLATLPKKERIFLFEEIKHWSKHLNENNSQ